MKIRSTKKRKSEPKSKNTLTTIEMETAIAKHFGVRQNIIVPNISWGLDWMHECDMFIVKKSGYATEVEIKRSKTDLLADFNKGHGHVDIKNRISEFYYALTEELYEKCKDLIPLNAGILVCRKYFNYGKWRTHVSVEKKAVWVRGCRKLTEEEKFKVAKLGTMRIWSLKEKIIKLQNEKAKIQKQTK